MEKGWSKRNKGRKPFPNLLDVVRLVFKLDKKPKKGYNVIINKKGGDFPCADAHMLFWRFLSFGLSAH